MTPIEDVFKIIERLVGSSDLDLLRGDESNRNQMGLNEAELCHHRLLILSVHVQTF